jgi:hypothetical protein
MRARVARRRAHRDRRRPLVLARLQRDRAGRRIIRNAKVEAPVAIALGRELAVERDRLVGSLRVSRHHQQAGKYLGIIQSDARLGWPR